ncbi:MAG TPA: hypothetical protein VMW27_23925 [Thermoanaerobaculia bacterium]|nr:hypothetical protein [Thermoanaerobaculia bacterium]
MAKTVADYQVLCDGGFTLDAASNTPDKGFAFFIPQNFKFLGGNQRPILAFHVHAFKSSRFRVKINTREILTWNLTADTTRGLWDPFEWSTAFPEGSRNVPFHDPDAPEVPNTTEVEFRILEGKIEFGQVVLWYQVEV